MTWWSWKTTQEHHHEASTIFNSQIKQAEEETEDQLNEIKWEGKIREKRVKKNEQILQDI